MPRGIKKNAPIHDEIDEDRAGYHDEPELVKTFRDYAKGRHKLTLTDEQKEIVRGILQNRFSDNACHQVLAEASDRIIFLGWQSQDKAGQQWLTDLYTTSNIEDRSGEVHYDALRDSNTVLSPAFDPKSKRVVIYREEWWDGDNGIFIGYDNLDRPKYGVKEWWLSRSKAIKRRLIWFDDRFERYISNNGGINWSPYALEPEPNDLGEITPDAEKKAAPIVSWLKKNGKSPLHIPYVHFPNAGRGSGNYGVSELDGGVLGFQDQINETQYALSACGQMTAFQIIWATGVSLKDPANPTQNIKVKLNPGSLLSSANKDARYGHIPAGSVTEILKVYDKKLARLAQMTRTPLHMITGGDWPSGEALLRAERPAVGKAKRQIKKFKSCYQTLGHRAIEIFNRFGEGTLNEEAESAMITALMAPPQSYDLAALAAVISQVKDILSDEECLRKLDYSEDQIKTIMKEKEDRDRRRSENAAIAFSRGTDPGSRLGQDDEEEVPNDEEEKS